MNAKEFFDKYEIEEISKKTKISPISLRYIKNKEFEKIPRVKFLGFIKIIEKEFKVDLSELVKEYNEFFSHSKEEEPIKEEPIKEESTTFLFFLAIILLSVGGYLLYKNYSTTPPLQPQISNTTTPITTPIQNLNNQTTTSQNNTSIEKKPSNIKKPQQKIPKEVIIVPNEKVWFKALNIDTNKTVEKLTSHEQILKGSNWYIKFGHGNITISYGNKTLFPDTKKIVRILLKDGNITIMKKPNRFER